MAITIATDPKVAASAVVAAVADVARAEADEEEKTKRDETDIYIKLTEKIDRIFDKKEKQSKGTNTEKLKELEDEAKNSIYVASLLMDLKEGILTEKINNIRDSINPKKFLEVEITGGKLKKGGSAMDTDAATSVPAAATARNRNYLEKIDTQKNLYEELLEKYLEPQEIAYIIQSFNSEFKKDIERELILPDYSDQKISFPKSNVDESDFDCDCDLTDSSRAIDFSDTYEKKRRYDRYTIKLTELIRQIPSLKDLPDEKIRDIILCIIEKLKVNTDKDLGHSPKSKISELLSLFFVKGNHEDHKNKLKLEEVQRITGKRFYFIKDAQKAKREEEQDS